MRRFVSSTWHLLARCGFQGLLEATEKLNCTSVVTVAITVTVRCKEGSKKACQSDVKWEHRGYQFKETE